MAVDPRKDRPERGPQAIVRFSNLSRGELGLGRQLTRVSTGWPAPRHAPANAEYQGCLTARCRGAFSAHRSWVTAAPGFSRVRLLNMPNDSIGWKAGRDTYTYEYMYQVLTCDNTCL